MNPLDLDVEERFGIGLDASQLISNDLGQAFLVGALDAQEPILETRIAGALFQLPELTEIGDPAVADGSANQIGEGRDWPRAANAAG